MCIGDFGEQELEGGAWGSDAARGMKDEAPSEGALRLARLVRTIEGEIVPRLVLARRVACEPDSVRARGPRSPDTADIRELVRLLLCHEVGFASAYVDQVRSAGASLEAICLNLLAPAARELGLLWEEDECDFMQVTVGLCRLHQLLRELSPEFRLDEAELKLDRRIMLAPIPGEQHTFGITLVAQFLRRAGWEVWHEFPSKDSDLFKVLRENWFAVVGLSVGNDARLDEVSRIIRNMRAVSRNRSVAVMVGGPLLVARPELAEWLGADATASDGLEAVERAEQACRGMSLRSG